MLSRTAALVAAIWIFLSAREEQETEDTTSRAAKRHFPSFALLQDRELGLAMLASILNTFSNDRIFTFLPLLLMAKGIDPKIIGTFAFGFTVGSFLGKMACGRLVDRLGSRAVFIAAELALTVLLTALIFSQGIALIVVIALLLGIVTKGTVPVVQTIITEPIKDPALYTDVFSINSFVRGIVNIITPLLFGLIAAAWNMNVTYAIMAVVAAIAVVPVMMMEKAK